MSVETNEVIIPSNPADRKKIMDVMQEISDSMTRVNSEKTYQKEAIAALAEEFNLPKKYLSKFAKAYFNQNYSEVLNEQSQFEDMIAALVPSQVE